MVRERVRVAAVQIHMHEVPSEERWKKHLYWMKESVKLGADVICMTEFFLGGETYWRRERIEFFKEFCKKHSVYPDSYTHLTLPTTERV